MSNVASRNLASIFFIHLETIAVFRVPVQEEKESANMNRSQEKPPQAKTHSGTLASSPSSALPRRAATDRNRLQTRNASIRIETAKLRELCKKFNKRNSFFSFWCLVNSSVDHIHNSRNRDRRFGNVGRQNNTPQSLERENSDESKKRKNKNFSTADLGLEQRLSSDLWGSGRHRAAAPPS